MRLGKPYLWPLLFLFCSCEKLFTGPDCDCYIIATFPPYIHHRAAWFAENNWWDGHADIKGHTITFFYSAPIVKPDSAKYRREKVDLKARDAYEFLFHDDTTNLIAGYMLFDVTFIHPINDTITGRIVFPYDLTNKQFFR